MTEQEQITPEGEPPFGNYIANIANAVMASQSYSPLHTSCALVAMAKAFGLPRDNDRTYLAKAMVDAARELDANVIGAPPLQ